MNANSVLDKPIDWHDIGDAFRDRFITMGMKPNQYDIDIAYYTSEGVDFDLERGPVVLPQYRERICTADGNATENYGDYALISLDQIASISNHTGSSEDDLADGTECERENTK